MTMSDFLRRLSKAKSTILNDIWLEIVIFTLVALVVTAVTELTSASLEFDNQLMTVLGVALGFVISFRTSTAYERFTEGRLLWTNIAIASRTLAQIIWIQLPFKRDGPGQSQKFFDSQTDFDATGYYNPDNNTSTLAVVIEKKTIINLVQAYSVSVKHMLRGETGVYYKDLYPLVACLPRFATHEDNADEDDILPLWTASEMNFSKYKALQAELSFPTHRITRTNSEPAMDTKEELSDQGRETQSLPDTTEAYHRKNFDVENALLPTLPYDRDLCPARIEHASFLEHFVIPFFRWLCQPFKPLREFRDPNKRLKRNVIGKKIKVEAESNVPMEIVMFLLSYHGWLVREQRIPDFVANNIYNNISLLQNDVVHLERIKNTPIPFAYQAHLRISLWMYLFFLPSQLYSAFHWLTIPATAFSAFVLLGFLEIGQEIENPFDYDEDDLDLDKFCHAIQRELHEVTTHTNPYPPSHIFSIWNKPFSPTDPRDARQIISDASHPYHFEGEKGMYTIRKTMLKSWKRVDEVIRSLDKTRV